MSGRGEVSLPETLQAESRLRDTNSESTIMAEQPVAVMGEGSNGKSLEVMR